MALSPDISQLSNLPTDSLYKFLALSGLVILIISCVAPIYVNFKVREAIIETRLAINKANIEIEFANRQENFTESIINQTEGLPAGDGLPKNYPWIPNWLEKLSKPVPFKRPYVTFSNDQLRRAMTGLFVLERDTRIYGAKADAKNRHLKNLDEISDRIQSVVGFVRFLGIMLAIWGFALWYIRVQKPIDIHMRKLD